MRDKRDSLDDVVRDILRSMVAGELGPLVERFRTTVRAFVGQPAKPAPPDVLRPLAALQSVPVANTGGGVYFLVDGDQVVYVGQSVNVFARVGDHLRSKAFDQAFYLPLPDAELDLVEAAFISLLAPPLNGNCGASVDPQAAMKALRRLGIEASLDELSAGRAAVIQRLPVAKERLPRVRKGACEFLATELARGPVPANEIRRRATEAGFSERTAERAKQALQIRSIRTGRDGWSWTLITDGVTP